ncbi:MAG: thiamine pyrophosphate-binding protein [Candidatus Omnitrophota bacterium]
MIRLADYVADFIYDHGVRCVFMLTGGGSIYLDDGLACHKGLKHICVRSEATAPMMAEAYARLLNKLGVAYVTTGPGGANAVSGVAEAWVDSAPILIVSGQVRRDQTTYNAKIDGLRTLGVQELNIVRVVESITKYAVMVNDPAQIRYHLEKAVWLATTGRPGPVWVDIPLDIQAAMIEEKKLKGFVPEERVDDRVEMDSKIDDVIDLLKSAKRPLVIAGQGVRIDNVVDDFVRLVESLKIPVVFSRLGQDLLPFSHRNNFGHGGMKGCRLSNLILKESDLIIGLGSRLAIPFICPDRKLVAEDAKVIMVDIDQSELKKPGIEIHLPILKSVREFIEELSRRINKEALPEYLPWLETCGNYKKRYSFRESEYKRNPIDLYYFISRLDDLSEEGDVFVSDAGSSYYATGQVLRFEKKQREITSGAFASMGLAVPLAIGCAAADSDKRVLAITGDGSLELNIQELKTLSYHKMNIKVFVINNGGYASIRNTQEDLFDGRYIGSDQFGSNELLDFKKVAAVFDLPYFLIQKYEETDEKIREVISRKGPAFVEVVCDNSQKIIDPL